MSKARFTLIEILLVSAVIIVLAAILIPALSMTKERARIVKCTDNLKNAGTGVQINASDYNEYITAYSETSTVNWAVWPGSAEVQTWVGSPKWKLGIGARILHERNYVRTVETFYCPSDPVAHPTTPGSQEFWASVHDMNPGWYQTVDRNREKTGYVAISYNYNPFNLISRKSTKSWQGGGKEMGPMAVDPTRQPCTTYKYSMSDAVVIMDRMCASSRTSLPSVHQTMHTWNVCRMDGSVITRRNSTIPTPYMLSDDWTTFDSYINLLNTK